MDNEFESVLGKILLVAGPLEWGSTECSMGVWHFLNSVSFCHVIQWKFHIFFSSSTLSTFHIIQLEICILLLYISKFSMLYNGKFVLYQLSMLFNGNFEA